MVSTNGPHRKDIDLHALIRQDALRDPKLAARFAKAKEINAPVVAELQQAGFPVEVVEDLYHMRLDYRDAIPILLRWLPFVEDHGLKQTIARALSVRWAKPVAAKALIEEFPKAPPDSALKWAIGNALSVVADDAVFDELVALATDKRHGKSREMVVVALGNMRNPSAADILIELLDDEEVAGHAIVALRKLAPKRARPHLEKFLSHPKTWVRNEAKAALAKIDKKAG